MFKKVFNFILQKLSDLLAEELKNTLETYPVITHSNLLKIVQNASLGLDETELQQVQVTCIIQSYRVGVGIKM